MCSKQIWYDVKRFVSRLLSPDITLGAADYYVAMVFFDILCFLTIIFGFSSFGVSFASWKVCLSRTMKNVDVLSLFSVLV